MRSECLEERKVPNGGRCQVGAHAEKTDRILKGPKSQVVQLGPTGLCQMLRAKAAGGPSEA